MHDLIHSTSTSIASSESSKLEFEMYAFVMDQLGKLEERLLGLLTEAEEKATKEEEEGGVRRRWTVVPRTWAWRTSMAVSWLPVRAKALELVRQRDALGSRVLFAQMSMISSKVRDQEARSRKREELHRERLERLETMVYSQHEKLDRLEDLVYRVMHRDRVGLEVDSESPKYEEQVSNAVPTNDTQQFTRKPEAIDDFGPVPSS